MCLSGIIFLIGEVILLEEFSSGILSDSSISDKTSRTFKAVLVSPEETALLHALRVLTNLEVPSVFYALHESS